MNKKTQIFVYIFAALVIVIGIYLFKIKDSYMNKAEPIVNKNVRDVINFSDFYTVHSCISKYIMYKNQKNIDGILGVLSVDYQEANKIKSSNVVEKLSIQTDRGIFISKKMLYAQYTEDTYIFYVAGLEGIDNTTFDNDLNEKLLDKSYYIVYLNKSEKMFSIEPYDGKIFKDGEL